VDALPLLDLGKVRPHTDALDMAAGVHRRLATTTDELGAKPTTRWGWADGWSSSSRNRWVAF